MVLEIDENNTIQLTAAILDHLGAHPRSVLAVNYSAAGTVLLSLARPSPERWRDTKGLRKALVSAKAGMTDLKGR
jgi:hypothetical protein